MILIININMSYCSYHIIIFLNIDDIFDLIECLPKKIALMSEQQRSD